MGVDGETQGAAELEPDRYYLLSDAGSFFFDPAGDNDGFESPEAAAEWARTQSVWPELDLSDGYAVAICSGASSTRPPVHNYGRDLGLVREEPDAVRRHRTLLDRLKWR